MPGHSVPSGLSASGKATPPPSSTPVAQPVEQSAEQLEGEKPFQPFKGIEEQDLSPVRGSRTRTK